MYQLYVTNFDRKTKHWELSNFFCQYLTYFHLWRSKNKGKSSIPYAYITLKDKQETQFLLNSTITFEDKILKIEPFFQDSALEDHKLDIQERSIYFQTSKEQNLSNQLILETLSQYGTVQSLTSWEIEGTLGLYCTKVCFHDIKTTEKCLKQGSIQIGSISLKMSPHRPIKDVFYDISVGSSYFMKIAGNESSSRGITSQQKDFQTDWFGFKAIPRKGASSLLKDNKMQQKVNRKKSRTKTPRLQFSNIRFNKAHVTTLIAYNGNIQNNSLKAFGSDLKFQRQPDFYRHNY